MDLTFPVESPLHINNTTVTLPSLGPSTPRTFADVLRSPSVPNKAALFNGGDNDNALVPRNAVNPSLSTVGNYHNAPPSPLFVDFVESLTVAPMVSTASSVPGYFKITKSASLRYVLRRRSIIPYLHFW